MGSARDVVNGELSELELVRGALADEYDVLAELGRGGMAIVFRARDRALERDVAIKVLPLGMAYDGDLVERFQREARTSAQLEHPNIVPIYRVGKSGGGRVSYFVMKYVRGASLGRVLTGRPGGKLAPEEIRAMLADTARALAYAARNGVVHRDIKPDNILFDDDRWVLVDFGIAKVASARTLTDSGTSVGTPRYMSPEQARARPIDKRADIYSLGIVAYQCLVGRVPFDGEDGIAILFGHVTTPVPTPTLETDAERALYAIVRRMIAKEPDHRVQDGDALLRLLDAAPGASTGIDGSAAGVTGDDDATPRLALPGIDTPRLGVDTPRVDGMDQARGTIVREWTAEAERRRARWRRWAIAGAAIVVVGAAAYAIGGRVARGSPVVAQATPVVSAVAPAVPALGTPADAVPAAATAPTVTAAPTAAAAATPRATMCDATGGTSKFHMALDPLAAHHDTPVDIAYAVCGLPSGAHYRTVVTLSRHESGIKKLLGSRDRTTVVFDDRASGPAVRARHRLPRLDAGTYGVTVTVTDARGRRRTHDTTLAIR